MHPNIDGGSKEYFLQKKLQVASFMYLNIQQNIAN